MQYISRREIATGLVVAVVLIGSAKYGLTQQLGAHPFWSFKVGYIGVGIGMVLYLLQAFVRLRWGIKAVWLVIFVWCAAGITFVGKIRFAASYAEDLIAGRMWFLGWIAGVALAYVLIVHLLGGRR